MLTFLVPGRPVGKERPRWSPRSRTFYTPHKTHEYEARVASLYRAQLARGLTHGQPPWIGVTLLHKTDVHCDADNLWKSIADAVAGERNENDKKYTGAFALERAAADGAIVTIV